MSILINRNSSLIRQTMARWTSAITVAAALLGLATEAGAARWVDKYGRTLALQAPGLTEAALMPGGQTALQAATMFKTLCIDTGLDRVAAGRTAEAAGFTYSERMMPFKQPVDVGSWTKADAELSVGSDLFFAKDPQCNLAVALAGAPDRDAVVTGLSTVLGQPVNLAKATKKDGTPDRRWQPEWVIAGGGGTERRVFVHQHQPNVVQFAIIERKGAK